MRPQADIRYMYTAEYTFISRLIERKLPKGKEPVSFPFFLLFTEKKTRIDRKISPVFVVRLDDEDHSNSTLMTMGLIFHLHDNGINLLILLAKLLFLCQAMFKESLFILRINFALERVMLEFLIRVIFEHLNTYVKAFNNLIHYFLDILFFCLTF